MGNSDDSKEFLTADSELDWQNLRFYLDFNVMVSGECKEFVQVGGGNSAALVGSLQC